MRSLLVLAALVAVGACADPALVEYDARMERLVELSDTVPEMRQPVEVVTPPTSTSGVVRATPPIQVTPTEPPPDPRGIVNSLPYQFYNPEPAKQAWYIMTDVVLGWDVATQDAWWPFAKDVMLGESGFCWNRLRGDVMHWPNDGCDQKRQGTHEDAGFGQVTWVLYGPHSTLCQERGLCSRWDIIAEPWTSMLAMIHVMAEHGSEPWCWNARARAYHDCWLAPDR